MSRHTPGEWQVHDDGMGAWVVTATVTNGYTRTVAQRVSCTSDRDRAAQSLANARLIAAAPDLLDACKMALTVMSRESSMPESEISQEELEVLRAAIKKAEGEG